MNPHSTPSSRHYEPRESDERLKFNDLRRRLLQVVHDLDDDQRVFINGQTFLADDIRFLITTMQAPK